MRKKLIVANWKSNKTCEEAKNWLDEFKLKTEYAKLNTEQFEVVIAPPFVDLPILKDSLSVLSFDFTIKLCAQNVSPFAEGSYTGEVCAKHLSSLADYCLVGHSERRKYFLESNETISKKIELLLSFGIKPILCASDETELPQDLKNYQTDQIIVMYEPSSAISQNGIYRAQNASSVKSTIDNWKVKYGDFQYLYGGSVNPENALELFSAGAQGFVIGKAGLEVDSFLGILQHA